MEDRNMKTQLFNTTLGNTLLVGVVALAISGTDSWADPAPAPYHLENYTVQSGVQQNPSPVVAATFSRTVQAPAGTPWMRVHFSKANLTTGSFITVESLFDGAKQTLDGNALKKWHYTSAYFNGDAVKVSFHAAPGEMNGSFDIEQITVGERATAPDESQCGATDNRVASANPAVGRIMPIGCTGWLVSNGAVLTAGHCITANTQSLHFNIPASLPDGTLQNPPPQDQYPLEPVADMDWFNDGAGAIGNDWAVIESLPNTDTGRLAVHVQNAFYRMSRDLTTTEVANVRVTGYGTDTGADNQIQQTHSGAYVGETVQGASDVTIRYTVDTEGGNSGSPVIFEDSSPDLAMGIHTNGGCNTVGSNAGTSFEHDNLENAIRDFHGTNNVEYVDRSHYDYVNPEDGSVFRPHDTFLLGVTDAAARTGTPVLSVVSGTYPESAVGSPIVISDPMHIIAPVGKVTIR
jgi:V8-like Glu-specific endopeptidase